MLAELCAYRDRVQARRIEVFETPVQLPVWEQVAWSRDWRYEHDWPGLFYRQYNFYERHKPCPYDVKYPWELSRLSFLVIPTMLEAVSAVSGSVSPGELALCHDREPSRASGAGEEPDAVRTPAYAHGELRSGEWPTTLEQVLASWQRGNPLAASVNWYPMECAMRAINLVQVVQLLVHCQPVPRSALRRLLVLCELHGRFLFRTVEYSDVRGNHFAAELAPALAPSGTAAARTSRTGPPPPHRWLAYSRTHLEREPLLQYSRDGVQMEKSIPYHRLVTQLLLVSLIALEKAGLPIGRAARERLHEACRYTKAYTRPDGLAPMWGDNDDARALWLDCRRLRDHRGLTSLAAAYFDDADLASPGDVAVEVPLLLGRRQPPAACSPQDSCRYFAEGGMVCVAMGGCHFVADVGEVGLCGRGGHGHLDSLSFELSLDGVPLIVDPGSYVYTGDLTARNRFRATAAHNVARIDGMEMASFFADKPWRLGNEATPHDVHFANSAEGFELQATHDGYRRLPDPVTHQRCWRFRRRERQLEVRDSFLAARSHRVERFFHFDPRLQLTLEGSRLMITGANGLQFVANWDPGGHAELLDDHVSEAYGTKVAAKVLCLRNRAADRDSLQFAIRPL